MSNTGTLLTKVIAEILANLPVISNTVTLIAGVIA